MASAISLRDRDSFYFSTGNLKPEQFTRLQLDLTALSTICSVYTVLQGVLILYRILNRIHNSKTNLQRIPTRLHWLSAIIIFLIIGIAVVLIAVVQFKVVMLNKWSDFVIDTLIISILITWLLHWRESVRVLIKKRFTKAVNN